MRIVFIRMLAIFFSSVDSFCEKLVYVFLKETIFFVLWNSHSKLRSGRILPYKPIDKNNQAPKSYSLYFQFLLRSYSLLFTIQYYLLLSLLDGQSLWPFLESCLYFLALYDKGEIGSDQEKPNHLIFATSSDRGLCGGIHSGMAKAIKANIEGMASVSNPIIVVYGDKVRGILQRTHGIENHIVIYCNSCFFIA